MTGTAIGMGKEIGLDAKMGERTHRVSLWWAACGAAACAVGAAAEPVRFFQSYLFAYLLCLEAALGCLALLMIHALTGGEWGTATRRFLEAGAGTIPWMAPLFLPIAFGLPQLYPWARPFNLMFDESLRRQSVYLNTPFFLARAALYFAVWSGLAWALPKLPPMRRAALAGPGLVLYGLTMHFAAFDWGMSLEPEWHSTLYGFLFIAGQAPAAMALLIIASASSPGSALERLAKPRLLFDLGNLLLAFVMVWAYLSFMQFLIIWSGNLPEEVSWYVKRSRGGWQWVAVFLAVFQFALPFLLLLMRGVKGRREPMLRLAVALLAAHWVGFLWLIKPAFSPGEFRLHWLDVAATFALGSVFATLFSGALLRGARGAPQEMEMDPRLRGVAGV
jgi:hypothetical protein